MNCVICGLKNLGTTYHSHFGGLCPQCEGELRNIMRSIEYVAEVPKHIPPEQHKRYVMTILQRDLGIKIKYR